VVLVAIHRLRMARDEHDLDVVLVPRAWPPEWVNGRGTPRAIVTTELVAAARRLYGVAAAEEVDYALRLAFFRDSADVSVAAGLRQALELAAAGIAALDPDAVMDLWMESNVRSDVATDYRESRHVPIQGSPQIVWPDGSSDHNPGMTDHEWRGGLVRIKSTDRRAPERRLLETVRAVRDRAPGPRR
jgi:hypothetical protein